MAMGLEGKGGIQSRWKKLCALLLLVFGIILTLLGIALIFFMPHIIEGEVRKKARLIEGSELYGKWVNPPYIVKSNIYVYSVNNPDEILNGSKPELTAIGPFLYDENLWNEVVGTGNGTIKYRSYRNFKFNKSGSCPECDPKRKVWIPNVVYQKFVEAASSPSMKAAQSALSSQTPFLEVSVEDMLFKGYKDPFLDKVCEIPFVNFICETILDLPEKIAFLAEKNHTSSGIFEASTGELDNGESLGRLITWNDERNVPDHWWGDEFSTKVNGSDGSLYKPYIQKSDVLYIFVPDLCRSIHVVFEKEIDYKGVPGYRFVAPENLLDWSIPGNEAFCFNTGKNFFSDKEEKCLPNGLIDVSRCQKGEPPIVVSLPNFLFANETVKKSVVGLNESSPEHDNIVIEIEPKTGTVLRVERRSQINVAMWKGSGIDIGADLSRMHSSVIPLLVNFEEVHIDDETLSLILDQLIAVEHAAFLFSLAAIIIGLLIVVGVFVFLLLQARRTRFSSDRQNNITRVTISPITEKPSSMG